MKDIKTTSAFVFVDNKGNKLYLVSGFEEMPKRQKHYWMFKGNRIPFPIRSNTWFTGLRTAEMIKAIEDTGYILKVKVNYITGKVDLYKL